MQGAVLAVKNLQFDESDLNFYFKQLEIKMKSNGVKKNYTKLEVLTSILPKRVIDEVKPLLLKEEDEFTENDAYFQLKKEILRIFGPTEASSFQRAMGRVLSGKPSQLARQIINDMCDHNLDGCCCRKWVFGLWHQALPTNVKAAVAHHKFDKDTLKEVLELADKVYDSTRPQPRVSAASVAAVEGDTAFHEDFPSEGQQQAEVAAVRRGGARGGRGRGGRGGNQRGGGQTRVFYTESNPRWKGPSHPDLPPFHSCKKHWDWGKSAHWCLEPTKCPWKKFTTPKSTNTN